MQRFIFTFPELLQSLKVISFHNSLGVVNCLLHPCEVFALTLDEGDPCCCVACEQLFLCDPPNSVTVRAVAQQQQYPKKLIPEVPIPLSRGFCCRHRWHSSPYLHESRASPSSSPALCSQELGHTSELLS